MGNSGLKAEKGYTYGIHIGLSLSPYLSRSVMPFKSLHLNNIGLKIEWVRSLVLCLAESSDIDLLGICWDF